MFCCGYVAVKAICEDEFFADLIVWHDPLERLSNEHINGRTIISMNELWGGKLHGWNLAFF